MGTGSALVLDGHDVALVRAAIVDNQGAATEDSSNITFTVLSGPGRVLATHNGDNRCHEPNHASWHSAFNGLVRAIIQVKEQHTGSPTHRHTHTHTHTFVFSPSIITPKIYSTLWIPNLIIPDPSLR